MNDMIKKIAEKTGISEDICKKVTDAIEGGTGAALLDKIAGKDANPAESISAVASKLNLPKDVVEKVMKAVQEFSGGGIADALGGLLKK